MTNITATSVLDAVYPFNFQDTEIQVLDVQGRVWLTAADLSRALGYARADFVSRIYDRNKDEFTEDMTTVIELQANKSAETVKLTVGASATGQARIFSTQGCHLIAMLARTEKAKEFRRWVLAVLGGLDKKNPPQKKSSKLTEFGKAGFLEQMLDKAADMVVSDAAHVSQQRIDKLVQERADKLVEADRRAYFGNSRLLVEPNGTGGFNARTLKRTETVLCDSQLAEYIADWRNGPATYFLPAIMQAVTQRMTEMCNLPFVEREHDEK